MNMKKTVIIFGVSAAMLGSAIALSMWLTKGREVAMEVSNPKNITTDEAQTKVFGATDMMPLYYDDDELLLLPLRSVVQGLGGAVAWDAETKHVDVTYRGRKLLLSTGKEEAVFNGYEIEMPVAPETINGTLYVDATIITEFFATEVVWDSTQRQISMKAVGKNSPVVATAVLRGEKAGRSYELDAPVVMGLNDVSFEKSLNDQIRMEIQRLGDEFLESPREDVQGKENTETFHMEMEKGFISGEFLSLCWKGVQGEAEIVKTINVDLREQRIVSFSDLITDQGAEQVLLDRGQTYDAPFYITKEKELAIFEDQETLPQTMLYPVDGAALGESWNPKYKNVFLR